MKGFTLPKPCFNWLLELKFFLGRVSPFMPFNLRYLCYMLLIVFLFGLAMGSFLNALIYRLHEKKSLFSRSTCSKCGAKIAWFDNIPLLSFVLLRGRCRKCQIKISWQYPIVELTTGLLFLFVFLNLNSKFYILDSKFYILLLRDWLIIFAGLFIFIYDLKYLAVEDRVVLPLAGLIFIFNLGLGQAFTKMILAVIISIGFFALQYFLTRGRGLGLGDLRIGFFMAATLSWPNILLGLFLAYLIGALVALSLLLGGKKKLKDQLPLGPFLVVGTFLTLFWAEQIISWHFN